MWRVPSRFFKVHLFSTLVASQLKRPTDTRAPTLLSLRTNGRLRVENASGLSPTPHSQIPVPTHQHAHQHTNTAPHPQHSFRRRSSTPSQTSPAVTSLSIAPPRVGRGGLQRNSRRQLRGPRPPTHPEPTPYLPKPEKSILSAIAGFDGDGGRPPDGCRAAPGVPGFPPPCCAAAASRRAVSIRTLVGLG